MSIPPALRGIRRVLGENAVEHVHRKDLTAQVPVVARVVAADQVAERGLAVAPVEPVARQRLGPGKGHDLGAQLVERGARVERLERRVRGRRVHGHVEDAKVQLPQRGGRVVDVLGADERGDEVIGQLLRGRRVRVRGGRRGGGAPSREVGGREAAVVPRQRLELRRRPAPVLEHLRRRFDKVLHDARAVEARESRLADQIVDSMAEF